MLLAIDAGNTNVVFALVDASAGARTIRARWRIATDPRRTGDEYAVWINQLLALEGLAMTDVEAVIISTVVPRALHNLEVLAQKYFRVDPLIAGQAPVEWHINVDVPMPQTLGADRAVNAIAAHDAFAGDLIVIDFGTATTFDHIDYSGAYKGGIIAPGINLSLDALVSAARQAPPHRHFRARERERHRPHHREPDAHRRVLGLCCDDGRSRRAHASRDRSPCQGHFHRRPGCPLRREDRHFRLYRA